MKNYLFYKTVENRAVFVLSVYVEEPNEDELLAFCVVMGCDLFITRS